MLNIKGNVKDRPRREPKRSNVAAHKMTDQLVLDQVGKQLVTNQLVLTVGYDTPNLTDPDRRMRYAGPIRIDHYGRPVPKEAHGSIIWPV